MQSTHIVIGSGPAGVSAAVALLSKGHRVLMLDAGQQLEPERTAKLVHLQGQLPETWAGQHTAWLREGMEAAVEGIPTKLTYGSDFPYRTLPGAPVITGTGVNTKYSLGKGGFSAVWGSAVMPYRQHDLDRWPITAADLAPHYRAVLGFMPVAQQVDALESAFPTFLADQAMPLSAQAAALESTLTPNQSDLAARGLTFGRSRLAVNHSGIGAPGGCVRCGLCMYGCPYGIIYSTAQTVDVLLQNPDFTYAPRYVVQRVDETADRVSVQALTSTGTVETFTAERLFVGTGVLSTTALMLRSLSAFDTAVTLRESHYFLLPMLRLLAVPGFTRGNLHTLAQLFFEILDDAISPYTIHLQTYTYNDLFEQPIQQKLGPLRHIFPWKAFLSRLFLFQGYLHSDHSPTTQATLRKTPTGDELRLIPTEHPQTTALLRRLTRKLSTVAGMTGIRPLTPLMRRGEPGRGFHTGSSFPMSSTPAGLQADTLGRPANLRRIHLVDSSVLPTIPATTITYTVMANAHRIATLAD